MALGLLSKRLTVEFCDELHLAVSMWSFRAESVSAWVKLLLDQNEEQARNELREIDGGYREGWTL